MMLSHYGLKRYLKTYALIIIFRWKNGITIKTMFMYCSEDSLIVRFLNLSMLIKVPVAGTPVEVIRQYIETQGEKKY